MKPVVTPALVSAVLAGALVVASTTWLAPGRPPLDTVARALCGAIVAFGVSVVLLRITRA